MYFIPYFYFVLSKLRAQLVAKWQGLAESYPVKVDVWHWISRATFDVIGLAGFGYEFNAICDESNEVYLAYKEMFEIAVSQGSDLKSILGIYIPWIWKVLVCLFIIAKCDFVVSNLHAISQTTLRG